MSSFIFDVKAGSLLGKLFNLEYYNVKLLFSACSIEIEVFFFLYPYILYATEFHI